MITAMKYICIKKEENRKNGKVDWLLTIAPFAMIMTLVIYFFSSSKQANELILKIRYLFGNTLGSYYIILGLGTFAISVFLAFSKYGSIVLGNVGEKPKYSFFTWGSMMFTCGLAADILFYSFSEWVMYADNPYVRQMGGQSLDWASVFSLFHWSFIPWGFYLVLAASFGFMLHCKNRDRQRFSEACIPIIGENNANGLIGRLIDLFALFALLAGTATTFSVATPLIAEIALTLLGISLSRAALTILILVLTCGVYTYAAVHGIKGMGLLAKLCIIMFYGLCIFIFLVGGQERFIIENGIQSIGKLLNHFVEISTYTDPARTNQFPQDWTIYYWAYWMVWSIATPFFIGNISRGRTIKQVILGGYFFGVGSTIISFIVLGNYSLGLQISGTFNFIATYENNGDLYQLILSIIDSLPKSHIALIWTALCMILFYATSFDSIAYTAACYSYKKICETETPHKAIIILWCFLMILLPIALTFSESSMNSLQSVSIISAFPIGIIMVLIIGSFFKDAARYLKEQNSHRCISKFDE